MYCSHLSLTNFRNYLRLELDLHPGVTILQGNNAQGKTNLLEAVFFLATTKSLRAGSDRELINWVAQADGFPVARVAAEVRHAEGTLRVEIGMQVKDANGGFEDGAAAGPAIGKRVRVNGVGQRALDYLGRVNVVMFAPQDLDLVSGQPSLRRRYLDVTSSQVDPRYVRALQQYNRVLQRRNHLLRLIREGQGAVDQLAFWDEQMVEHGAYLVARRRRLTAELDELAQVRHRQLAGTPDRLRLQYLPSLENGIQTALGLVDGDEKTTGKAEVDAKLVEAFRGELERRQARDVAAGTSLVGPHRDDLILLLNRNDVGVFSSHGEQRTAALSLKLAEVDYLRSHTGEQPILLLDDVLSELDSERRRQVLDTIARGQQVLVTTTEMERLETELLSGAQVLRVDQGRVERITAVQPVSEPG